MEQVQGRGLGILAVAALLLVSCTSAAPPQPTAAPGTPSKAEGAAGTTAPAGKAPAASTGDGKQALEQLIAKAKQETAGNVMLPSEADKAAPKLADAFKRRFGLANLQFKVDASGGETGAFQKATAETQAGATPTFDAMQTEEVAIYGLIASGGVQAIENWEPLLREINPLVASGEVKPDVISPQVVAGKAFIYTTRDFNLYYNTDKVKSVDELPKTREAMADPKYKGRFAVPSFLGDYRHAPLVYDKEKLLTIADNIGKNAAVVLTPAALLERLMLGEFDFGANIQSTGTYLRTKAKDPRAPLGIRYYTDYTPLTDLSYIVIKGARSPASATLWALWMTTEEAQSIRAAEDYYANLVYGRSDLDKQIKQQLQQSGSKVVNWFGSKESVELMNWYATKEGREYLDKLTKALTQRK